MGQITLKDIANIVGVSPSTVSRVINSGGYKSAGEDVKKRIWDAVRQTGYVPNMAAKLLKTNKEDVSPAATAIHCLFARTKYSPGESYFQELASHIRQEILRNGCRVGETFYPVDVAEASYHGVEIGRHDGLMILGKSDWDISQFAMPFGKRVVHITLNQMSIGYDHIMCDGVQITEIAMRHLHENNHCRIAYVGEYQKEVRYKSYLSFLNEKKLKYERELTINVPMSAAGGYEGANKFLQISDRPTSAFCANDVTAIGFIKGLKDSGVAVPRDVSIVSVDNIAAASETDPGLTTVSIPLRDMGTFAVKTLLDRINKGHSVHLSVFMPPKLVIRESVRRV